MRRVLSLLTALTFICCSFGAAADIAADPVVVRVGDVVYRLSEVQTYWESLAEYLCAIGESISAADCDTYEQSVVESYVGMGVLENKLIEFGLEKWTAEDNAALDKEADRLYAEALEVYTQQVMSRYNRTHDEAEPYAKSFMELDGYTMAEARAQALRSAKEARILSAVAGDAEQLTDGELEAYYRQNLVLPSQTAYENDIEAFEYDVLAYGGDTYYIPDGYRYVRHIFLKASDETLEKTALLEEEKATAEAALTEAENKLHAAQLLEENIEAAEEEAEKARERLSDIQSRLDLNYAETLTLYADVIEDIKTRLANGESFSTLMEEYSQDDLMPAEGFMICADSVIWEASLKAGAMALKTVGEASAPVVSPTGVHILEYTSDAPSGAVPLEGELKEAVAAAAYQSRQYSILNAFVSMWREEYTVETHPALLSVPQCLLAK